MDTLTLYHRPGTRSGRVKMLVDLLELDYQITTVSPEEQRSDAYLALNPFGLLPTVTHGDRVILESGAQMMYLADLVPEKGMAPPVGTPERGTYYEWFVLTGATMEPLGTKGFQNPDDPEAVAGMQLVMGVMQDRLQTPYAMGSQFTSVDVLIHWQLNLLQSVGALEAMPKAQRYYDSLLVRMDWTGY